MLEANTKIVIRKGVPLNMVYLLTIVAFVFVQISVAWALPDDQQQMIYVRAGSADLSQKEHRGVYRGGVEFDQGATHLRAEQAMTESNNKNQLTLAVMTGRPKQQAHYWTLTERDKPELHAFADTMYYYPEQHLIKLVGRAKVQQGKNTFVAPIIQLNTLNQQVISEKSGSEVVKITIDPEGYTHDYHIIEASPKKAK